VHEIRTIQGNVAAMSEPSISRFVPRDLQADFFVTAPRLLVSFAVTSAPASRICRTLRGQDCHLDKVPDADYPRSP
jgi:hypothetical protein